MSRSHEVKIWPVFFEEDLPYSIRENDRSYQKGDRIVMKEFDPDKGEFTGRERVKIVGHVLSGWGVQPGYVCLSFTDSGWVRLSTERYAELQEKAARYEDLCK